MHGCIMAIVALDKIDEMWQSDSKIDSTEPGTEILRIPVLHAKYIQQIMSHSLMIKRLMIEYNNMRKLRVDYYNGRMDKDQLRQLGWSQFGFVLKSDINVYLDADPELSKIKAKMVPHEEAVSYCNLVVKELNARTYQLRAYCDWEKFVAGK